jgi:hypothetical protein
LLVHVSVGRSTHAKGRADRREHPGLPERTQTGAADNGGEQTFNRLTKIVAADQPA